MKFINNFESQEAKPGFRTGSIKTYTKNKKLLINCSLALHNINSFEDLRQARNDLNKFYKSANFYLDDLEKLNK